MISEKIKALMTLEKTTGYEMANKLGMKAPQYSRKMTADAWKAQDLLKIAKVLGWRVAFTKGDQRIYLDEE